MNRYVYRIIFSERRDQWMAVAETAVTAGKAGSTRRNPVEFKRIGSALAVLAASGVLGLPAGTAHAQIVANPAAPGTQQATVLQSTNGVPLVNIQTPNAVGVSMNRYSQFDVQQSGAILNNSRKDTSTQLGGWVQGNPWLATGPAGVIVNQVESSRPSLLNGYTEVAGQRAGVVIANPSGISVNGGGFINASGVTLTTGTPQFGTGGAIASYNVQGGQIGVGGQGLDLSGTEYAQLLARAVSVNAGLWANDLRVITGANQVSADGQSITPGAAAPGAAPTFAVDVGQLGGMYAGKIFLVGTEAGLGVSNAGAISAASGPLTLSADGKLTNSGTLAASGAGQDANLSVKGLANSGTIASQRDVNLADDGAASGNSGQISAARQFVASVTALDNQAVGTIAAQRLQIAAQTLRNAGTIQQTGPQDLSISTAALTNTGAVAVIGAPLPSTASGGSAGSFAPATGAGAAPSTAAGGSQVVAATPPPEALPNGGIQATLSLSNSGSLLANGATDLAATRSLTNRGTLNVHHLNASGSFDNRGGVAQVQDFSAQQTTFANQGGRFYSHADLNLNAASIDNTSGQIASGGSLAVQAQRNVTNAGGALSAQGDVTLAAQSVDNSAGGQIASTAGSISITAAGALDNQSGDIHTVSTDATGTVTVQAASVDNGSGRIAQAGTGATHVVASGTLTNDRGQIVSNGTLGIAAGTLSNNAGTIAAEGGATIAAGTVSNRSGTLQAGGGTTTAPVDLIVTSAGAVDNAQGTLAATGNAQVQAGSLDNSAGTVTGLGALAFTIDSALTNTAGTLQSNGDVTIASGGIVNDQGGIIIAVGNLDVATGALNNQGGTFGANGAITVRAHGVDNRSGAIHGATVNLQSTDGAGHWAQFDNRGGVVAAKNVLTVHSAGVDNTRGTLQTSAVGSTLEIASHGGSIANRQSGKEGGILAAGDLSVNAQGGMLDNSDGGYIGAVGTGTLAAGSVVNHGGVIAGNAALGIASTATGGAGIDNGAGAIESKGSVTLVAAAGIINAGGMLHSDHDFALQSAGVVDNTAGTLDAGGNVTITDSRVAAGGTLGAATQTLVNGGGSVHAGQAVSIASRSATGDGKIEALGDLTLALADDYTQTAGGTLAANGLLTVSSLGNLTNQGQIAGGTGVAVSASGVDNRAGASITSAGTTSVSAAGTLTNRGLIDGSATQINAGTFDNIGSGRVYGDHVSVAAGTVNNGAEGGTSATIAARGDLDIGATTVNNTGGATLLSLNDMRIGGALDGGRSAIGQAREINNAGSKASPNSGGINAGRDLTLSAESVNNTNPDLTIIHDVSVSSQRMPDMYSYPGTDPRPQSEFAWTRNASGVLGEHLVIPVHPERFAAVYPPAYAPESTTCPNTDWGTCTTQPLYRESRNSARFAEFGVTPPPQTAVSEPDPAAYGASAAYQYDPRTNSDLLVYYWPSGSDQAGYNTALAAYNADQAAYTNAAVALNNAINAANAENKRVYDSSVNHGNDFAAYASVTQQVTEDRAVNSGPGLITAGGDIAISGRLNNIDSAVIAGGSIAIRSDHLNNQSTKGTQKTTTSGTVQTYHIKYHDGGLFDGASYSNDPQGGPTGYSSTTERTIDLVPYAYLQGAQTDKPDGVLANGNAGQNVDAAGLNALGVVGGSSAGGAVPIAAQYASYGANGAAITVRTLSAGPSLPASSLYTLNAANPNAPLVETDPAFTNQSQWLNSDFMLQQLGADPVTLARRLGDGFYEQQLIQQQVGQLTGQRFLGDYTSSDAEYRALMTAGVSYAKTNHLRPGIALTPEQIAALTSDIVWLVNEEVNLPDGSTQTVLVPKLYVVAQAEDLAPTGALISGKDVIVGTTGDVNNSGTIAGRRTVQIIANDINDTLGRITGNQVTLAAVRDINVVGGSIEAAETLLAHAGRDLNVASTTRTSTGGTALNGYGNTTLDRMARINVGGAGSDGILYLGAARDLSASGAQIGNDAQTGTAVLDAGRNLTLGTVGTAQALNIGIDDKRHINRGASSEVGTRINTTGDIRLVAGQDIIARAASVQAQGELQAGAGGDVRVESGTATRRIDDAYYSESSGFLSHSSGRSLDQVTQTRAQGSSLGGKNVMLAAGQDLTITGSSVIADRDTTLVAGRDIAITAAENATSERRERESHESGFLSGGGFGITYGTRDQSGQQQTTSTSAAASTVGSIAGNVDIRAGNHYQQTGGDVVAPGGDVAITAEQINIQEAREQSNSQSEQHFRQSGITLALSSPVISAIQTAGAMSEAAGNTSSGRMQALAAASAGLAGASALGAIQAGQGQIINGKPGQIATATDAQGSPTAGRDATALDKVGGMNLSISLGTSKSDSQSEAQRETARGSSLQAGKNVILTATGASGQSNLTIQGSSVTAGGDLTLVADNQINLLAAENSASQTSKNSNSSSSAGMSIGTSGFGVTVGASKGRGNAGGADRSYSNTDLTAGRTLTIRSGGDTTLIGATAGGHQIIADVGGSLTIESLQDTSTYESNQRSIGGSVTFGTGMLSGSVSASGSNIRSDYRSVDVQSALRAGDGGFDVNVQGATNLKGGAITSTQEAVDHGRNRFQTASLNMSDLQNHADYDADALGVTLGSAVNQTGSYRPTGTGAGIGSDGDNASSITRAAISGITGDTQARTNDAESGVRPIFDVDKVQKEINAQIAITQEFTHQAGVAVRNYADGKRAELRGKMNEAQSDEERAAIAQDIKDVSMQERALNILVGTLAGNGAAAVTRESLSAVAEKMRDLMIEDSEKFAGVLGINGKELFSNISGGSAGINGDGKKIAGTRVELDLLCGVDNRRCVFEKNQDGSIDMGQPVKFIGEINPDGSRQTYEEFLKTADGKQMLSAPFGGLQGGDRTWIFGLPYEKGSWVDNLLESFAGPHDMIGGKMLGLYDEQGNATRGRSSETEKMQNVWSGVALVPAAPLAASQFFTAEQWGVIATLLNGLR